MRAVMNRYSLKRPPFTKEVATEDLFVCEKHAGVAARLQAAIESKASAVLTGEVGVGKTSLLRGLGQKLHPARFRLTYLHNATVSSRDFYRQLSTALALEPKSHPSALFRQVQAHIEDLADEQKVHPVVLLDEAHLLSHAVLENLHMLLNFHMDSRSFLSIVLIGLPELRDRLARNILSSLSTRLPVRAQLEPLSHDDIAGYLRAHMRGAGCDQEVFSEEAVLGIREATGGIPRKINVLAQHCLEQATASKSSLVDGRTVQAAIQLCAEALR